MKLYKKSEVPYILRITITRPNSKESNQHIIVHETTIDECLEWIAELLSKTNSYGPKIGNYTNIAVREEIGARNGKAKSISFYGKSTEETYKLIMEQLDK